MNLTGKTVLVTGGSSGIGQSIAKAFIKHGSKVIIFGLSRPDYKCEFHKVDVGREDQIKLALSKIGNFDVLVNNAGIAVVSKLEDSNNQMLNSMIDVNVKGLFWMCKHSIKKLRVGGAIINISSIAGLKSFTELGIYSATKSAVISLTKTLAIELADRRIRVNAIAPGVIDTPIWGKMYGKDGKKALGSCVESILVNRVGRPEEIAHAAIFLAENDFTNGETVVVDGGELANDG